MNKHKLVSDTGVFDVAYDWLNVGKIIRYVKISVVFGTAAEKTVEVLGLAQSGKVPKPKMGKPIA